MAGVSAARDLQLDTACPDTRTLVEHVTSKWGVLVLLALDEPHDALERAQARDRRRQREDADPVAADARGRRAGAARGAARRTAARGVLADRRRPGGRRSCSRRWCTGPTSRCALDRRPRPHLVGARVGDGADRRRPGRGRPAAQRPPLPPAPVRRDAPAADAADADVVLVSHLHPTTCTCRRCGGSRRDVPIVVPRGGESLLRGLGPDRVAAGRARRRARDRRRAVPSCAATHDGGRGPHSKVAGPPLGFRVDAADRSFWFPGDTELRDDMADVGRVDLALIPIGGWGPTLEDGHMDPVAGAAAVARVGADGRRTRALGHVLAGRAAPARAGQPPPALRHARGPLRHRARRPRPRRTRRCSPRIGGPLAL